MCTHSTRPVSYTLVLVPAHENSYDLLSLFPWRLLRKWAAAGLRPMREHDSIASVGTFKDNLQLEMTIFQAETLICVISSFSLSPRTTLVRSKPKTTAGTHAHT